MFECDGEWCEVRVRTVAEAVFTDEVVVFEILRDRFEVGGVASDGKCGGCFKASDSTV